MNLSDFRNARIMVVGDLMIDEYLWGRVERISPEAPVPVVTVEREEYTLGGAGNVVANLATLGASVTTVGVIGVREDGRRLLERIEALGQDTGGIFREPDRPTTRKTRVMAGSQHVLRIDRETRSAISESVFDRVTDFVRQQMASMDIVLVSDYGKGLITPPLMATVIEASRRESIPVVADPKGRNFDKYGGCRLVTPNRKEASLAAGMDIHDVKDLGRAANRILEASGIDNLLVTCGKDGMHLFQADTDSVHIPARARQVFDVSGAGDTVVAVVGLAMAAGATLVEAAAAANAAAGVVVGKVGTATVTPAELRAAMGGFVGELPGKYREAEELAEIIRGHKRAGQRIVMTNGCFDLLHAGHVDLLAASKRLGDILVVAIDDDDSVRSLKGPGRPVLGARERIRVLDALDAVDYLTVFGNGELDRLIEWIRPDVLTKGSNYTSEEVAGREKVESYGGRIERIPVDETVSASRIIREIQKR
ncbi:MAG: D-glycero-beta-D-manno-heptose-7-phosphate kinase [Desulfobacteraceae bacterium]|nr:D-glycero-beta-D-manno-heptose-7-phosphate kinase [Desulfobacteraceae bacterium]